MTPAGERAYETNKAKSGLYAYERELAKLEPAEETLFRKNKAGWADWEKRPPGYRKTVLRWVTSAKRPETRAKRLATVVEDSAAGRKIAAFDIRRRQT